MQSQKSNLLRRIINLRYLIHQWRLKSRTNKHRNRTPPPPPDVPPGYVAIHIGSRRFIVCATHLNHPNFQQFLLKAEEEYGFANHGPITIPCDEHLFEDFLRSVSRAGALGFPKFLIFSGAVARLKLGHCSARSPPGDDAVLRLNSDWMAQFAKLRSSIELRCF